MTASGNINTQITIIPEDSRSKAVMLYVLCRAGDADIGTREYLVELLNKNACPSLATLRIVCLLKCKRSEDSKHYINSILLHKADKRFNLYQGNTQQISSYHHNKRWQMLVSLH
uniref:Uncharacterized protein n=1 Tax=Arundo donax TaxID=35708 RepID=A0A0A9H9Z0_ARUDO